MSFTPANHPLRHVPVDPSMYATATAALAALPAIIAATADIPAQIKETRK